MSIRLTSLRRHRWLASLAMLAFVLRALIPAGFMPGGEGHLLEVCPDGFPVALLGAVDEHSAHAGHHHHHSATSPAADSAAAGTAATGAATDAAAAGASPDAPTHDHRSWTSGHCVFSAVAIAPPLSHPPIVAWGRAIASPGSQTHTATVPLDIRFRIAQPRAPPHLA